MSDDQDLSRKTLPWMRSGFDLEGYVGALAAWLVGILLGILWSPLFWIGFVAAVIILLATRTAERTPSLGENNVVAPNDGIVVSVAGATPPSELRLEGAEWTKVRISVGPTASNGLYAPIDGAIDHIISETGDPAAFAATKPDRPGLAVTYVSLESGARAVGFRLATGGLGPRLELSAEPGDAVRLGRNIGTMRLGGWCDLYLPSEAMPSIVPGQTVIGAETVIATFGGEPYRAPQAVAAVEETDPEPEMAPEPEPDPVEEVEDDLTLEEVAETADQTETEPASPPEEDDDVKEMFARLRKEASKSQDGDES